MPEVSETLASFIKPEIMHDEAATLAHDQLLLDEGIVDSFGLQRLLTFVEEEFETFVDDEYLLPGYFESVKAIAELVTQLKS